MIDIEDRNDVANLIRDNKMSIIYFTGSACGACEAIKKGKIENILNEYPKIVCREVNGKNTLIWQLSTVFFIANNVTFYRR